jgi:hypothetical protein
MKKGVKIALGIGGVIILGVTALKIIQKQRRKKAEKCSSPVDSTKVSIFPLTKGAGMGDKTYQVEAVKLVQEHLNKVSPSPYLPLIVDGKFGEDTEKRLNQIYKVKSVSREFYNKM